MEEHEKKEGVKKLLDPNINQNIIKEADPFEEEKNDWI